jgi:hypothetical protein
MLPSNATLNGAPVRRTLRPVRSPVSAARKSDRLSVPSNDCPFQENWPVAAKVRENDGQASANSTLVSVSTRR